jgi:beta-glucosidase-like glycosyl hydrolase
MPPLLHAAAAEYLIRGLSAEGPKTRALSVRGPYLNVMRDPRDGRNQERPSEDAWWCGEVGAAWIRGVQDGVHSPWQDPRYHKVIFTGLAQSCNLAQS